MKLADFVVADAIVPDLQGVQRDEVIGELVDALVQAGAAAPELRDDLVAEIIRREQGGSTGFGKGVAVPHARHGQVTQLAAAIGISQRGIDFNALDKAPVYTIVLLLSPQDQKDEHLQAMENIFSNLQKDTFRRFLRQAATKEDVQDLIHEADTKQLAS